MKKWLWIIGFGLVLLFAWLGSWRQVLRSTKPDLMLSLPKDAQAVEQQPPPGPAGKKRGKGIEELGGKR